MQINAIRGLYCYDYLLLVPMFLRRNPILDAPRPLLRDIERPTHRSNAEHWNELLCFIQNGQEKLSRSASSTAIGIGAFLADKGALSVQIDFRVF